jgi:hypothetical protein
MKRKRNCLAGMGDSAIVLCSVVGLGVVPFLIGAKPDELFD